MADPIVTIEEAKAFIRVDHHDDDEMILQMIATAEEACREYLDDEAIEAEPEALKSAVLAHVAALYDNRSGEGIPEEALSLLRNHREWVFA